MGGMFDMVAGNGAALSTVFGSGTVELRRSATRTLLGPEGPGCLEGDRFSPLNRSRAGLATQGFASVVPDGRLRGAPPVI